MTKYSLYDKCEHSKTYVVIIHEHEHFKVLNKIARPCKCEHSKTCVVIIHEHEHFKVLNKIARPCKCNYSPHYQRNKNDKKNEIKHDNKGNNVKTTTDTSKTSQIYMFYQKKLNSVQCRLLSKGLRFVPTKKNVDIGKHIADLKLWERRMRLREFVYQQNESFDEGNSGNSENSGKTKTQKKSTNTGKKFTPNEGRNRWLDQYIIEVKNDIMKYLKRDFKNNMTKQEAKTMNDLLNDDTIILRPSDNGSGIAVMDADKYKDEIESDLNDNTTYKQVDDRVILKTENKIKKLIEI
jgi:hypothetical protein